MKYFWHNWLAIAAAVAYLSNSAAAQHNWNHPSDIGSYQTIVSRAGIGSGAQDFDVTQQPVIPQVHTGQGHPEPVPQPSNDATITGHPLGIPQPTSSLGGFEADQGHGFTAGCGDYFDSGVGAGSAANWVVGTRALFFNRTREAAVPLSRFPMGELPSTINAYGTLPGAEVTFARRTAAGNGLEFRYWGLFPDQRERTQFGPALDTRLIGFEDYQIGPGFGNLWEYYNDADLHSFSRENEFHNFEINTLRNVGAYTTRGGRTGNFELLGGFRWLYFNEDYTFSAITGGVVPSRVDYDLNARNNLLGFQLGGRNEVYLSDRISLLTGTQFGLFNNNIRSSQRISNEFGGFATPAPGVPDVGEYDYLSRKNDLAAIGEVDLGLAYQFAQRARITAGYRIIGISGVALAPSQIPRNFRNPNELQAINSRDSLILGGAYGGFDFCF